MTSNFTSALLDFVIKHQKKICIFFPLCLGVFFLTINLIKYRLFNLPWTWDLATLSQLIYNFSRFKGPSTTIYACDNYFAWSHFSIILYVFTPLYYFFQGASYLIFLSIASSVTICWVYLKLGYRYLKGYPLLLIFPIILLHPTTLPMFLDYSGRDGLYAAVFLALSLLFFIEKRFYLWALTCVLASFCVEYIGATVAAYVLPSLFQKRHAKWSLFSVIYGLGFFYFAIAYAMPALQENTGFGGWKFAEYAYLGDSPAAIIKAILMNPMLILENLNNAESVKNLVKLTLPFLFLLFIGWEFLLVALPIFFMIIMNRSMNYTSPDLWHIFTIVPFFYGAGILGMSRVYNNMQNHRLKLGLTIVHLLALAMFIKLSVWGFYKRLPDFSQRNPYIHQFAKSLPKDVTISVQEPFTAKFSNRDNVHPFPGIWDSQYIILSSRRNVVSLTDKAVFEQIVNDLLRSGKYEMMKSFSNGDFILQKVK